MDWLLTVPLLLMEIVLVMKLDASESKDKCIKLGSAAVLMVLLGYPGELVMEDTALCSRWIYWVLAMIPFICIVWTLRTTRVTRKCAN
jgi:bacteriorhodopsin